MNEGYKPSQVAAAYQDVFKSPEGQIVLAHLVRRFGHTRGTLMGPTPEQTAFNEGQRMVIVEIGRQLDLDTKAVADLEEQQQLGEME